MEGQQDQQDQQEQQEQHETPKQNGSVIQQEASSTTPGEIVVTKHKIRFQTWKKLRDARCGIGYRSISYKIPNFVGKDKAAALLADTEEFKNAKNIKVNIDSAQDPVKLLAVSSGKNLYLPPPRGSNCLFTKIECPEDADERTRRNIIRVQNMKDYRKEINLDECPKLDIIILGSVAVSRNGYRIGRGRGFVDLDVGILIQAGAITPDTLIVTTVHDLQVVDQLPTELFKNFDTPVDIIVTPSEVIRVSNRLPRPAGIYWELLSERRLRAVPLLQVIKAKEESAGKVITLRSTADDGEFEANGPPRQRPRPRRYFKFRDRRTRSETNNENDDGGRPQRRRKFNRRRRQTKSEGEHSVGENKENDQTQPARRVRKKFNNRNFLVKVSKIARGVRIRDLKAELRKRECKPVNISWKANYGRCYLYFAKRKGAEKDEEIEKVLKSLNDLSLTIENGERTKTIKLEVELINLKEDNTIEPVNTSTV